MSISINNQSGGIINVIHGANVSIRQTNGQQSIQVCDDIPVVTPVPVQEDAVPKPPTAIPPDFFRVTESFSEANICQRLDAELSQATTKKDYCRGLYRLQHIGCINIDQYASDAQRADVFNRFQSKYNLSASDFCKARMN